MNASGLIDDRVTELSGDWRGPLFARLRDLINAADSGLTEDWKWNTAVWTCGGLVCSVGALKDAVGVNFFAGAALPDPHGLFNAGLEAKRTRMVKFRAGDSVDETALTALVRAAGAHNGDG